MLTHRSGSGEHLLHLLNLMGWERFALGAASMHKTQCAMTLCLLTGATCQGLPRWRRWRTFYTQGRDGHDCPKGWLGRTEVWPSVML